MKFLIAFALLFAAVAASPLVVVKPESENRHAATLFVASLNPVNAAESGTVVNRKARQFGGFGGFGGGGYDNTNIDAYNQGGSYGGLGGFGSYGNSGFDYSQQQGGFGGGIGGFGF